METTTIKGLAKIAAGKQIKRLVGRVTQIYDQKSGSSEEYGDWTMQNLVLEQDGAKVQVSFKNRDVISKSWKNRLVEILNPNDKACKVTEYEGKKQLSVTKTCEVNLLEDDAEEGHEASDNDGGEAPATTSAPAKSGNRPKPGSEEAIKHVKGQVLKKINLYNMLVSAVAKSVVPHIEAETGSAITEEQFQATLATLFISAEKEGLAALLPYVMPTKEEKKPAAKPKPAPEPEPEPEPSLPSDDDCPF